MLNAQPFLGAPANVVLEHGNSYFARLNICIFNGPKKTSSSLQLFRSSEQTKPLQLVGQTAVAQSDVYGRFTRMLQHLDFTTTRRAHKECCLNARSGKHISLTDCFVISADVDSVEDKILSVSQTYGLCLALLDRLIWAGISMVC